jgi:hypothetical protein
VPPIFQPEIGAKAIYYAAHHRRREIYVGWPTVEAIIGNKIAPGVLDHDPETQSPAGGLYRAEFSRG